MSTKKMLKEKPPIWQTILPTDQSCGPLFPFWQNFSPSVKSGDNDYHDYYNFRYYYDYQYGYQDYHYDYHDGCVDAAAAVATAAAVAVAAAALGLSQ